MREILFRGKRVDNGEWIYGYYIKATHHWHNHGIHEDWIATDTVQNGGWCNVRGKYAVIPDTIGQFTGITDENSNKVFDGDILKNEYEKNKYQYFKVYYCNITHSWLVENKYGMLGKLYNVIGDIEIIGNIHDNPELLRTPPNDEVRE